MKGGFEYADLKARYEYLLDRIFTLYDDPKDEATRNYLCIEARYIDGRIHCLKQEQLNQT